MKTNIVRNLASGIHIYVCIDNFDALLTKEEKNTGHIINIMDSKNIIKGFLQIVFI